MIARELKLRPNKKQEAALNEWLWSLTAVYNWGIRTIELNAKDKIFFTKMDFTNLLAGHSKRMDIPSHAIQGTLAQAWTSWDRCFKKLAKKPKLKGNRRKFSSIPFPDPIKLPEGNYIGIPGLKKIRFHKQELPGGKIKCGRIVKRADGWFLCLTLDTVYRFPVKDTEAAVGIDPGFKTLLTLSDGVTFENPRELRRREARLAQAQRGNDKKLAAKLSLTAARIRKNRNHKISRKIIEDYKTIYYSDDNFKGMAKRFGKSVSEASLGQLIGFIAYKGLTGGRSVIPVNSRFTTMTCSVCGSLSGPKGWAGLQVRDWQCCECGSFHNRDINAAMVIAKTGAGMALEREICHA